MAKDETSALEGIFLREKPSLILLGMKTNTKNAIYPTVLSKQADCTYSHTIKILNLFEKSGIVKFETKGRIKKVTLTDDGWDIAHNIEALQKKFGQIADGASRPQEKKAKSKEKAQKSEN